MGVSQRLGDECVHTRSLNRRPDRVVCLSLLFRWCFLFVSLLDYLPLSFLLLGDCRGCADHSGSQS